MQRPCRAGLHRCKPHQETLDQCCDGVALLQTPIAMRHGKVPPAGNATGSEGPARRRCDLHVPPAGDAARRPRPQAMRPAGPARRRCGPQAPPAGDATCRSRPQAMRPAGPARRRCDLQVPPAGDAARRPRPQAMRPAGPARRRCGPQAPPAGDATCRSRPQAMRPTGPARRRCDLQVPPAGDATRRSRPQVPLAGETILIAVGRKPDPGVLSARRRPQDSRRPESVGSRTPECLPLVVVGLSSPHRVCPQAPMRPAQPSSFKLGPEARPQRAGSQTPERWICPSIS